MNEKQLPSHARVVIIGGGVIGCSVAYHLTKLGCKDVVLLERKTLTCGTTWHAAGMIGQLRATYNMTRLAQYTAQLLRDLEAETGQATGYRENGALVVTACQERFHELKRSAAMGRCFGLQVDVLCPEQAGEMWPLMNTQDLVGAVFMPGEGQANPIDTTQAYAKGAKMGGAQIFEHTAVTQITQHNGRASGVITDKGEIKADVVVNCTGMWGREMGALAKVNVPLHATEHFYVVTEAMQGLAQGMPSLRDQNGRVYFKEDAGKLLVGAFEHRAKPWGMQGIPKDFEFDQLPDDWDQMEPILEAAIHRIPQLEQTGIQLHFNGPESFTPDVRYYLGEAPELKNMYVAAGFNSVGIGSSGGAGKMLAEQIINGHASMDLWDVDIRRAQPFQSSPSYLYDRVQESLGLLYDLRWPNRQFETARGARRSPFYEQLKTLGACHGEAQGWERPNWFAPEGVTAQYHYSYFRQNWFDYSGDEHRAVRENVGLIDQSSFTKFHIQGQDAESELNRLCTANMSVPLGKVVYCQMLNPRGGIEADITVTRTGEDNYLLVSGVATQIRDMDWLQKNIDPESRVTVTDVTSAYAVLNVMGPASRKLLSTLTDTDLSNQHFPFATSQELFIGYAKVRALRITYVGELGWELYIPTEFAAHVFERICEAGQTFDLKHVGFHAINSLRLEKGYRHWGEDITDEDTLLEAGLSFTADRQKAQGFIGQQALDTQRAKGCYKRLVSFKLADSAPLLHHFEAILRNGEIVGYLTGGAYGHTVGAAVGLGYVKADHPIDADYILNADYEIDIACERFKATPSLTSLYDPKNEKIRA
ncbi:MAG: GcvT family protein [Pseudomonadales bacterium]